MTAEPTAGGGPLGKDWNYCTSRLLLVLLEAEYTVTQVLPSALTESELPEATYITEREKKDGITMKIGQPFRCHR